MDASKYGRTVTMNCPTCGNTNFEGDHDSPDAPLKCVSCGRTLTRDELMRENSENIAEHVNEVKAQIVKDLSKELKDSLQKAFKGSKNVRIK